MKLYLINFALWLYTNHIQEDWDEYTKFGKKFVYPFWFIRATLIWITSPLWIPAYEFSKSAIYKAFQTAGANLTPEQMKEINRIQTQNFLTKRFNRKSKR